MVTAHAPARPQQVRSSAPQKSTREINTSRTFKSPHDTSTIDFAYLPREPAAVPMDNVNLRVPLIPDNTSPNRSGVHAIPALDYDSVMRPQVVTAAGEATYVSAPSAMSDVHDNTAVGVDYGALAEKMEQTASVVSQRTEAAKGTVRQLWSGMLDDVLGPKAPSAA